MRWHTFVNPKPDELRDRARLDAAIDAWWRAFESAADKIDAHFSKPQGESDFDVVAWMSELEKVEAGLSWEFGPAVRGAGHRLVITPEESRELRPLTDRLLSRAPVLPRWEFYGNRLAEPLDHAFDLVGARYDAPLVLTGAECALGTDNRVDLRCTVKAGASKNDRELALRQALLLTATLLGEAVTDCWLGYIDVVSSRKSNAPLAQLKERFEHTLAAARAASDPRPLWQWSETAQWTLYDLKRGKREPGRRDDLFVYRTMHPIFFTTLMANVPFYSQRLSACGERFCYLMLDGLNAEMEGFADKGEIEDALQARLAPAQLGAVVGSGTGRRYSYVDLAVTDVQRACDAIVHALRQGRIARGAWILFHDDEWCDEWIGVYDDTPPPPNIAPR